MREAYLYDKNEDGSVRCQLCNHRCTIKVGGRGLCGVRENRSGTLFSLVYGKVIARHVDPIEKKPLFHFLPGTSSYSIATVGCNFRCRFCQNADISQMPTDRNQIWGEDFLPPQIVEEVLNCQAATIAYTYTEPTIYYELALDTARLASNEGIRNIFVSNGYMTDKCLEDIYPDLHAANIDLKAFSDGFYKDQCGAKLAPVLKTLETLVSQGVWLEVTTLLIPDLNDGIEELQRIARFLVDLSPDIPWHISRFHPTYRLTSVPSTHAESIRRARDVGLETGLKYVYTGNLPGDEGEKTSCHQCGTLLIDRIGFSIANNRIEKGGCPQCGVSIPGVWS